MTVNWKLKLDFNIYKDKVKGCFVGKNIGGTLGGPYEHSRTLLDVKDFTAEPGKPMPNDDLDLQLVWLHALENSGPAGITADILGELWLSFMTPHWNEYGIAKANLKRGIVPPFTGDLDNSWSNSNGAWIRTEIWACSTPGLPSAAVDYAITDASVDHGAGEGTVAAAFVAAMQSAAFVLSDCGKCIEAELAAIPEDSRTAKSVKYVMGAFKSGKPWQEVRNELVEMNSDIGTGWFEAPSNVAFAVLGLLYGEGDFKKSVLTALNCGDDTDCTAATVGATLGILNGYSKLPEDWCRYIGDSIVTISLSRGTVGKSFPNTCTELSDRITAVATSVLQYNNSRYDRKREYKVEFSEQNSGLITLEQIISSLNKTSRKRLSCLKENSMYFKESFLSACVTLSKPKITGNDSVAAHILFSSELSYENQPYSASLRWILPEGFTVTGSNSVFIPGYDIHTDNCSEYDFIINSGDKVRGDNRIVLEIIPTGRHTSMYISFVLPG